MYLNIAMFLDKKPVYNNDEFDSSDDDDRY